MTVQRIVVKNGLSMSLAGILLEKIREAVAYLDGLEGPLPKEGRVTASYSH